MLGGNHVAVFIRTCKILNEKLYVFINKMFGASFGSVWIQTRPKSGTTRRHSPDARSEHVLEDVTGDALTCFDKKK
jgi:hypothetical protein